MSATNTTNDDASVVVVVNAGEIPKEIVEEKCAPLYKSIIRRKKAIDLRATGDSKNDKLVAFLSCQSKATKTCIPENKEYAQCHKSFMGMGSYNGKRDCKKELSELYACIVRNGTN
mmetsp:Transcript_22267/g.40462  ORF Transcript_22267/g.40462 Transcript_22267/m.40462 type:complete len:116 (-) Transcript_22267:279-626(-)